MLWGSEEEDAVPVENGGASQDHRVIVCPFGRVAPTLLVAVPEVAAGRVAHDSLRKTLPDGEGKVHLEQQKHRFYTQDIYVNNNGGHRKHVS